MLRVKIRNNFIENTDATINSKVMTLPINIQFTPTDYEEQREQILQEERVKAINKPTDGETIKYKRDGEATINVRFYDGVNFVNDYSAAGFETEEVEKSRIVFKKSFYRLYFYDDINDNNNNLLFIEDVMTKDGLPTFTFDKVFWLKNDKFFNDGGNRTLYMDANFYNAKNGNVHKLINTPIGRTSPPSHTDVVANQNWLKVTMTLVNPNIGSYTLTTDSTITLTEDIRT